MSRGGRGGAAAKSSIAGMARDLGVDRTEIKKLQTSGMQPPPLFPIRETNPLPLIIESDFYSGQDMDYMVALKQEFLNTLHSSPFYFDDSKTQADVERYTDKLRKNQEKPWEPNYELMPKELRPKKRKAETAIKNEKKSNSDMRSKKKSKTIVNETDSLLEPSVSAEDVPEDSGEAADEEKNLEKNAEDEDDDEEEEKKRNSNDEDDEAQAEEEGDDEEYNDYVDTYFDNGEDYGEESEDNPDDAFYD